VLDVNSPTIFAVSHSTQENREGSGGKSNLMAVVDSGEARLGPMNVVAAISAERLSKPADLCVYPMWLTTWFLLCH
jgi:hypothetical protein